MTKIKGIVDDLALIGHPMSDEEIISHTLNGLQDEFKELTAAIRVRDSTISFEDLYDKLLDEEMIQKRGDTKKPKAAITAQFTQTSCGYKHPGNSNFHRNFCSPQQHQFPHPPGQSRSFTP